jgi:hypothetical protein
VLQSLPAVEEACAAAAAAVAPLLDSGMEVWQVRALPRLLLCSWQRCYFVGALQQRPEPGVLSNTARHLGGLRGTEGGTELGTEGY